MRGIVRRADRDSRAFFVECADGFCAFFIVVRGGFPFHGEHVRWDESAVPVTMVMGESSGTVIVTGARFSLSRAEADGLLRALAAANDK